MTWQMLAQYSSGDSGAAVLGVLIALAVIGLQIYLIYAIIATRQDVKFIREMLRIREEADPEADWEGHFQPEGLDRLREANELRESGILTDQDFTRIKEAILRGWTADAPIPAAPIHTGPLSPRIPPSPLGSQYSVIIRNLGNADPARVTKIIKTYIEDFRPEAIEAIPFTAAEGIGYATAEPLRADLAKAGTKVDMVEM